MGVENSAVPSLAVYLYKDISDTVSEQYEPLVSMEFVSLLGFQSLQIF